MQTRIAIAKFICFAVNYTPQLWHLSTPEGTKVETEHVRFQSKLGS